MKMSSRPVWDWISAGLLFFLLQTAAARLVTTEWAPNLHWTESLAGLGTILGLALGASRFRFSGVIALTAAYTALIIPWQITAGAPDELLLERLNRISWILWISLNQFTNRLPVKDPLFFVALVCLAFWLIGVAAGYALARRGQVLGSIAAAGAALLVVQAYGNYQPRGSWWLAVFLLFALLLVGRVHFLRNRIGWTQRRVFVSEESGTNILTSLFMTAAVAIVLAWWIPNAPGSMQRATELWNTYIEPLRERLSNAVTSLQGPYGQPGRNFYGSSLALGQNASTGDEEVLTITVVESPGLNMRYYWRGRAYNVYDGGLWSVSTNARLLAQPEQGNLGIPDADLRAEGTFEVSSEFRTQSLLYAPAPTVWIDRSADVAAMRVGPNLYDAFSWEARTTLASGNTYQVRALLRNPSIQELRSAGEAHPEWLSPQYLAVPERYRKQLEALAQEITEGQDSRYDKAAAITDYLRNAIEYSPTVPNAPEGRDPVIWVLFEHKKGFCNYYASAEVLLLRAVGIPARLAVGFSRGDLEGETYTVLRRNAHAWPEVYFPEIGWVEFEPTSSEAPLTRPSGIREEQDDSLGTGDRASQAEEISRIPEDVVIAPPAAPLPFALTPTGKIVYAALPVILAVVALALAHRVRLAQRMPGLLARAFEAGGGPAPSWIHRWVWWNELEPVQRAFAAVGWTLRLLGQAQPLNSTPAAQAAALTRALPSARNQVRALKEELETGLFTPLRPDNSRARTAAVVLLFHGLRARVDRVLAAIDGRVVYSDDE